MVAFGGSSRNGGVKYKVGIDGAIARMGPVLVVINRLFSVVAVGGWDGVL